MGRRRHRRDRGALHPLAGAVDLPPRLSAQPVNVNTPRLIGTQRPPRPIETSALAVVPVWAYVPADDAWATRRSVPIGELAQRRLVVLPDTFTARDALDAATASRGLSYADPVEAANGTIAQALAASGRGVAVVSDDPRFDLQAVAIETGGHQVLRIRLWAAWDPRGVAAPAIGELAQRLGDWVTLRYPAFASPN